MKYTEKDKQKLSESYGAINIWRNGKQIAKDGILLKKKSFISKLKKLFRM